MIFNFFPILYFFHVVPIDNVSLVLIYANAVLGIEIITESKCPFPQAVQCSRWDTSGLHICAVSATQGCVITGVTESEEPHLIQDRKPG